ncbi:Rieske 2Fe-2S domain-containing protein [Amycolatopsis sp. NPDC049868]|uniref:Rieske 2Fe-2S domain-containing protein n=1 Tax=Amycolatopsis sp. NPDC049868 TaxID=3363934 RepID=UPI00378DC9CD
MTETSLVDSGTGYGRKTPSYEPRLAEVGPGTPMGEALRRYWQPIAASAALTSEAPHRTRVLGEDLIVFRDGQGRPGVVFERCAHRGSSLYYGRVEDDGIRCCYHGWKFDVQGHCLEQACEPGGGLRRDAARQPWYPVEERYGLVFVYMGPPERKPTLPRYDCLEPQEEGERYLAEWPVPGMTVTGLVQDCNWLQIYENAIDPAHISWLHSQHSGYQFVGTGTTGFPENFFDPATASDRITYKRTDFGAAYNVRFTGDDSAERGWGADLHLPNVLVLPDFVNVTADAKADMLLWVVPCDDTHNRSFFSIRTSDPERLDRFFLGVKQNGKDPWELSEEERRQYPGDGEAQLSQGPVTLHSEETLATTDRGVVMLRRLLKTMVDDVQAGRDPRGVSLTEVPPRHTESGMFTVAAADKTPVPSAGA